MGTRTCIGAVVALALVLCASATASAARPKLRVDARTAVPGQVLVLTLPGSARHASVIVFDFDGPKVVDPDGSNPRDTPFDFSGAASSLSVYWGAAGP